MDAVSSVRGRPLQSTRSSSIPASAAATAFACATPSSFSGTSRGSTGEPSSREVRHLGVAHEVEAAAHRRRIARCWRATSSRPRPTPTASTKPPLLVLDRVRAFLDEHGLGSGEVRARRIGEGGGSNFTFLLERETGSFVLRRPPRPPLPPSAHDVVREARLQLALREAGFTRLPTIAAVCEDESLLGVPFYVMTYLDGFVPADELPPGLETEAARRRARRRSRGRARRDPRGRRHDAGPRRVRASGELQRAPGTALRAALGASTRRARSHASRRSRRGSPTTCPIRLRRPSSTATSGSGTRWSAATTRPGSSPCSTGRWARSAIRARTSATCSRRTASPAARRTRSARRRSPRSPGFPSRAELVERYVAGSGREVEPLAWFEGLALWKAAVFCEAIYGRYVRGELGAEDERAARFEQGVPYLAEAAAEAIGTSLHLEGAGTPCGREAY